MVNVVGAHPGAGATAVAVALADAFAEIDHPVTLLDLAHEPDAFAGAEYEVEAAEAGWRAGRRGRTHVLRPRAPNVSPGDRPEPMSDVVIDSWADATEHVVVTCRATLPSLRRVETSIRPGEVVAVVGVSRWPKVVGASLGPQVRRAMEDGRVVFVPFDRGLAISGIDAEPMPRSIRAAGRRLIEILWPDLAGSNSSERAKGGRR
ncbi:hypothetical protein ASD81_04430 [Nocardioides sp. Root614]|nr:hypothetical protein ASD81_04430 [Nocardioides sp. Root614]KRA91896.1 hypothetical protein ASD84_04695 [Nocardioides sp. Root682]